MTRRLLTFVAGCAAAWLLLAAAAAAVSGAAAVPNVTVAALVCGVPAFLTLVLAECFAGTGPETRAAVFAGGAVVRVALALGGAAACARVFPRLTAGGALLFWGWVILFYLFTLAWEVALVAGPSLAADRRAGTPAADPGAVPDLSPPVTRSS